MILIGNADFNCSFFEFETNAYPKSGPQLGPQSENSEFSFRH